MEADIADPEASVTDMNTHIEDSILPKILETYPGVTYVMAGQAEESGKTAASGQRVMPIRRHSKSSPTMPPLSVR